MRNGDINDLPMPAAGWQGHKNGILNVTNE